MVNKAATEKFETDIAEILRLLNGLKMDGVPSSIIERWEERVKSASTDQLLLVPSARYVYSGEYGDEDPDDVHERYHFERPIRYMKETQHD